MGGELKVHHGAGIRHAYPDRVTDGRCVHSGADVCRVHCDSDADVCYGYGYPDFLADDFRPHADTDADVCGADVCRAHCGADSDADACDGHGYPDFLADIYYGYRDCYGYRDADVCCVHPGSRADDF